MLKDALSAHAVEAYREVNLELHLSSDLELGEGNDQFYVLPALPLETPPVPLDRRLDGLQNRSKFLALEA